ncbi:unnamed protein product [Cuscuta epithymum]|uniref:Uncharacterized protein n=1 Tax=Cuscuta epithymum TaxID=186058 RepID=A0AAV0DKS7_9ASTE|nr:unnamed protein product [Cuscuta epithymum]
MRDPLEAESLSEESMGIVAGSQSVSFRTKGDLNMGGKEHEGGAKERVKEAAEKSFWKSKEAVEESAKTAAHVVGEAVQETKEKVIKGNMHVEGKYDDGDSHEEL